MPSDELVRQEPKQQPDDFGIGQLFWEIRDAVVVGDAETGRIVLWNPAAERLFGRTAAEAIGQLIEVVVPETLRVHHRNGIAGYFAGRRGGLIDQGQPVEVPAIRGSGEMITVELTLSPIAVPHLAGRFVLAVIRDATARKQAEADLVRLASEQAARAAAEAEARRQEEAAALLDTLLAAAPNGFALFDRELRFTRVNQALADFNGIPVDAHLGHTLDEVATVLGATQVPLIQLVLTSGEAIHDVELSADLAAGSATVGHWLVSYYPVHSRAGERMGVGAVVVDITGRKQLERMQQDFLAAVTHDLKSPLTALGLQTGILRRRAGQAGVARAEWLDAMVHRIEAQTIRMVAMVDDLADVAHMQVGQALTIEREPMDVVAVARRMVEEEQNATDRHLLTMQTPCASLVGTWDPKRIERVLANLLANAIKYSPDGGQVTVTVREEQVGQRPWAVVTVQDDGMGIPATELQHVFDRFWRGTNVVGRIAGSGIGLASAKQIVEQHGGTIAVEGQEGQGSTFTVRLPLSPVDRSEA